MPNDEWTRDSRFLRRNLATGEIKRYGMYSHNIRVEGDGLGYLELNLVRTILLEPIVALVVIVNMLLVYSKKFTERRFWVYVAHFCGFGFNILRIAASCGILCAEIFAVPFRFVFGCLLAPLAFKISAGHVYAMACTMAHNIVRGEGLSVVRKVRIHNKFECEPIVLNAGGLGEVLWYRAKDGAEASYIGATFNIQQRCGSGPECVWIRGRYVFVSFWSPINLTVLSRSTVKTSWKLLDLKTDEWRIMIFDFEDKSVLRGPSKRRKKADDLSNSQGKGVVDIDRTQREIGNRSTTVTEQVVLTETQGGGKRIHDEEAGAWALIGSDAFLGTVRSIDDLEEYYNSPLGWNKYHRMRAEGNQIVVTRDDRRALAHFLAVISSLQFYIQFRDRSEGWLGLSIDLYALVLANYTVVTAYAAELLIGRVRDVVEAKSERYGVMVTRAIDRGYVRGFHVVNGEWLMYRNGAGDLTKHEVSCVEVNVCCNSFVVGRQIWRYGYQRDGGEVCEWKGGSKECLQEGMTGEVGG